MIRYGLKLWSHNTAWFDAAREALHAAQFDFVELYANPAVPLDWDGLTKLREWPVTIHATHSGNFHTFVLGADELRIWKDVVIALADFFKSPVIVLHPGRGHTFTSFSAQLAAIDDPRIHIENMPGLDLDGLPMYGQTLDDLEALHTLKPICFDFEKAVKAARYQNIPYKKYISTALQTLQPRYFHISGGDAGSPVDQHEDLQGSTFDVAWIKRQLEANPETVSLAFETPKRDGIINDIHTMEYFKSL